MRKTVLTAIAVAVLVAAGLGMRAFGQSSVRVSGQLVDLACYSQDKVDVGIAHQGKGLDCAQSCAKEGYQVGLLTSDGKVYHIIGGLAANKNAKLWPHMAQTVTITGSVSEQYGQQMLSADDLSLSN